MFSNWIHTIILRKLYFNLLCLLRITFCFWQHQKTFIFFYQTSRQFIICNSGHLMRLDQGKTQNIKKNINTALKPASCSLPYHQLVLEVKLYNRLLYNKFKVPSNNKWRPRNINFVLILYNCLNNLQKCSKPAHTPSKIVYNQPNYNKMQSG